MDDIIEDRFGERVVRKGQVDPFAEKPVPVAIESITHNSRVSFKSKEATVGSKKIDEDTFSAFKSDVSDIFSSLFPEELPDILNKEPTDQTLDMYDNDPGRLFGKVLWSESLAGRKGVSTDLSDRFNFREVELTFDSPQESANPDDEREYAVAVRYLDENKPILKTHGIEFVLRFDANNMNRLKDCSFRWVSTYLNGENYITSSDFDSSGNLIDPNKTDLPNEMEGREALLSGKSIDITKTLKQWISQKPMLVVK